MSNFVFLNIGHDISTLFEQIESNINELRSRSAVLSAILWVPSWATRFIKLIALVLARGAYTIYNHSIPSSITAVHDHVMTQIPNSVTCFNKTKFLLFFVEMYFMCFYWLYIPLRKDVAYSYILCKVTMLMLPLMSLSPLERLPFWFLGFGLTVFEIIVGMWLITCWGYGIDWENAHFYHHWKKHYRYRYASGNRQITVELCQWLYPVLKLSLFIDVFCLREKWEAERLKQLAQAKAKLDKARAQTTGGLDFDFDYLTSLLEQDTVANLRYGILFLLALSSLGVYSIILAGWSSNSKYAFIGALRSAAQMISYEVAISLIILPIVLLAGSLNLTMITYVQSITVWFLWPLLPVSILFLIAMLAETNRTPFDLPEAEAELVAGYNVDYSSLPFAMFFLGEYCNMILISTLYCILFLGGGSNGVGVSSALILSLKAALTWIFFVLVRATLPRYRYDQLMDIGWKVFLPIAGAFLLVVFGLLVYFNALLVANELPLVSSSFIASSTYFYAKCVHPPTVFTRTILNPILAPW